ncbi:unnamed protein product [Triticum aestivum]|uniref:Uncharacterized protein n=1 Tax=Triticum aestivum TaxID=4565 RepID=A0A7H4LH72_WHEAT|nr:unnamed protein product [Triticum aestivum]
MGGGNAQKSKMARERNLEKLKGGKGSQLEANKKAMNIQTRLLSVEFVEITPLTGTGCVPRQLQRRLVAYFSIGLWVDGFFFFVRRLSCKICMQTFICTTSEAKCKEHAEAKHPKSDLVQCFPHLKQ